MCHHPDLQFRTEDRMPREPGLDLISAWLILIMSSSKLCQGHSGKFSAFPESRVRPHWPQRPRQVSHATDQTSTSMSSALARALLVLPGSQLWKGLCFPGLTCDLACIFLRGALSASMEAEVSPWPETALLPLGASIQ